MKRIFLTVALLTAASAAVSAQSSLIEQEAGIIEEQTLDAELREPRVPDKSKDYVKAYMQQIAKDLYVDHYEVETMRKGEVIVVTIPTDELFGPNETTLRPTAGKYLERFDRFLSMPTTFKVLFAVHSDDTGSESYTHDLTENRVLAILDYYDGNGISTDNASGFPVGAADPLKPNISRENRMSNRRLEIYIVPDTGLISASRSGKK